MHRQEQGFALHDFLMARRGHWLVLFIAGCCIQVLCMLAWVLSGGNKDYGTNLRESFWIAYVLLVDIGTQTSFSPDERGVVRAVAVVISIIGFVYCLLFLGMVVELIRSLLLRWKVRYSRVEAHGHWLILGWGDKTIFLLEELLAALQTEEGSTSSCCSCCRRRRRIVVLAERPVREMQAQLRLHFRTQDPQGAYKRLYCVSYREGCKSHRIELMKVCASAAEHILCMCSAETDSSSDHEAIRTLLALGALPEAIKADVWAEMHSRESARVVRQILPAAQGIVARHAVHHMVALRALVPSVGFAWLRMSTSNTRAGSKVSQLFLVKAPPALYGYPVKDIYRFFPDAAVCGVKTPSSMGDDANKMKAPSHHLEEGDELVMLSSSQHAAGHCILPETPPDFTTTSSLKAKRRGSNVLMDDGQIRLGPAADGPLTVLVIGCPDDFVDLLEIIDVYAASGSEVHLLSTRSLQWRESCVQTHLSRVGKVDFERISVSHYVGRRRDTTVLERLPLASADCALILSEREGEQEDAVDSDSRNLTIAINLFHVLEGMADVIKKNRQNKYLKKCKLVTEIQDPKSQVMLAGNSNVRKVGSFVFTSAHETGVFAIAVACKDVYDLFIKLIDPDPKTNAGSIVATPVSKVLMGRNESLSFFDLYRMVSEVCNGSLLGWRRSKEMHPVLNPSNKDVPLDWESQSRDELIILLPPPHQGHVVFEEVPKEDPTEELMQDPKDARRLETSRLSSITSARQSPAHSAATTRKSSKESDAVQEEEDELAPIPGMLKLPTYESEKAQASCSLSLPYPQ
eukprot:s2105_g8.t1